MTKLLMVMVLAVGSARGSYPPEREKIQIDNIRVCGNYAGGRSFEGDFSGRDNLGKVKVISKGGGDRRGNRSGVPRRTVVSASTTEG